MCQGNFTIDRLFNYVHYARHFLCVASRFHFDPNISMRFSSKPNVFMHRFSTSQRQTLIYNSMSFFLFLHLISLLSHGNIKSIFDSRHTDSLSHTHAFKEKATVIFAVDSFERNFFVYVYTQYSLRYPTDSFEIFYECTSKTKAFAAPKKVFHVK